MKVFLVILVIGWGMMLTAPALAQADDACAHDVATIEALRECVNHALAHGFIDSVGIARSLLSQLDDAQAALDQGDISGAIDALNAFINHVQALAGKHIVAEHASHLIEHAQLVINSLSG